MLIGFRQLSRLIQAPDFTTIFRRVGKLMIEIHEKVPPEVINEIKTRYAKVAIDSSGLSVTCRGEWLRYKHKEGLHAERDSSKYISVLMFSEVQC